MRNQVPPAETDARTPDAKEQRGRLMIVASVVVAALTALIVAVVVSEAKESPVSRPPVEPASVGTTSTSTSAPARPVAEGDFFGNAKAVGQQQADALKRGDEAGWMAPVDPAQPAAVAYFRRLYRNLRGLQVTAVEFKFGIPPIIVDGAKTADLDTFLTFCFKESCPPFSFGDGSGAPKIAKRFTWSRSGDTFLITGVGPARNPAAIQPTPWEDADLTIVQGKRVSVAASRGTSLPLARIAAAAEQAAGHADRFAAAMKNPQRRYRVYLADERQWTRWFGTSHGRTITGYAIPMHDVDTEVVLRMAKLTRPAALQETLRHEFGHVVTLSGTDRSGDAIYDSHMWLTEGIAEYIAHAPRPATSSSRARNTAVVVRSSYRPRTVVFEPLDSKKESSRVIDAYYGLAHFAVDCMATRYGEAKMLEFFRLTVRGDPGEPLSTLGYDEASKRTFGTGFRAVDTSCVTWIRERLS